MITNDEFTRKVIPFLKKEYFDGAHKFVFNQIVDFVTKYNKLPTSEALSIEISSSEKVSQQSITEASVVLTELGEQVPPSDMTWLVNTTEKWCQDRAIYLAIMESINIIDGKHQSLTKNALPELLSSALGVTFDANVGHDYINDAESRYEFYHRKEDRIPFDLEYLNAITKGGLPKKTLNIALAGCVHPSTKVKVRFRKYVT